MFIHWARKGIQERWFELVHQRGIALDMAVIDGTAIRAHKAAGAKRGHDIGSEIVVKRLAALVAVGAPRPV